MNNRQDADLVALYRVQGCLDLYASELSAVDLVFLRGKLDDCVTRLETAAADQAGSQASVRSNALRVNELRERLLRHHLDPIVEFSRANVTRIAEMQAWQMPADDATETEVLAIADGTVEAAGACREEFVNRGLPPAFVEELQEAIAEFRRAIWDREVSKMVRYGASLGMKYEFPVVWEVVRLMGVLIKREFGGHPQLMGAWQQARLHAPRQEPRRLRAPDSVKLLPAGSGPALIAATWGVVAADQDPAEGSTAIAIMPQHQAPPARPERDSLLLRLFRFFGKAA